jgi:protein TonB
MPQELLGDVFRTGDAAGRARRRLSILPLSVAAHALAGAALLIIPLAAEVELPAPVRPAIALTEVMPAALPPEPPAPRRAPAADTRLAAPPTAAPARIEPEPEAAGPPGPIVPGAEPFGPGSLGDVARIGTAVGVVPPAPPPPLQPEPIRRVGGHIREPKKLSGAAPVYPTLAQQVRKEGTVILEAVIDETGAVVRLRVLKSEPLLDEAAVSAVRQWRYTPTLLNNVPVSVLMTITVRFTLRQ